jgi:hypothetical protein
MALLWPAVRAKDIDMLIRHDLKPNVLAHLSGFTLPLTKRLLTCVLGAMLSVVCGGGAVCASAAPREQGAEHADKAISGLTSFCSLPPLELPPLFINNFYGH